MLTILIPVDFSENTKMVCRYALEFATNERARLVLFHIYPDQLVVPDSSFPVGVEIDSFLNTEYIDELRKQARMKMTETENWFRSLVVEKGLDKVEIVQNVTGGDPEKEISQQCDSLRPDLIVMGTRGEGRKGLMEGSMAKKIMNYTDIPVFAVPEAIEEVRLKKILYPTNFSTNDFKCLQKVLQLFSTHDIELFLIHLELKNHPIEDDRMIESLQRSLLAVQPDLTIHFENIDAEDKTIALQQFVGENEIEIIAFIAHKSNFFTNLFTREIHKSDLFKLQLPMLALHE